MIALRMLVRVTLEGQLAVVKPSSAYEDKKADLRGSVNYIVSFAGLVSSPCHRLLDTGAQDAVSGLWHFQRWMICLALCKQLTPRFISLDGPTEAGGVGGGARVIARCIVPVGIAGTSFIMRWTILDEEEGVIL